MDTECAVGHIPTLVHWTKDGPGAQLGTRELNSDETEEALRLSIARFVQESAAGKAHVDRVTQMVLDSGGKSCMGC